MDSRAERSDGKLRVSEHHNRSGITGPVLGTQLTCPSLSLEERILPRVLEPSSTRREGSGHAVLCPGRQCALEDRAAQRALHCAARHLWRVVLLAQVSQNDVGGARCDAVASQFPRITIAQMSRLSSDALAQPWGIRTGPEHPLVMVGFEN